MPLETGWPAPVQLELEGWRLSMVMNLHVLHYGKVGVTREQGLVVLPGPVPPGSVGFSPICGLLPLCPTQVAGDGVGDVSTFARSWLGETGLTFSSPTW